MDYRLPFLTDVTLGILGFSEAMAQSIKDLVLKQGGNYFVDDQEIKENYKDIKLILIRKDFNNYLSFKKLINESELQAVSLEWLANCQDFQIYIQPSKYDLTRQKEIYYKRKEKRLTYNV